jgi:predicted P-loop ATPase
MTSGEVNKTQEKDTTTRAPGKEMECDRGVEGKEADGTIENSMTTKRRHTKITYTKERKLLGRRAIVQKGSYMVSSRLNAQCLSRVPC